MHNNVIEYVPYSPWSLLVCGAVISTQAQRTQMASTDNNDRALLTGCPKSGLRITFKPEKTTT